MKAKALKKLINKIPDGVDVKIRVNVREEGSVSTEELDIATVDISNSASSSTSGKKVTYEVEQEAIITTDETYRYGTGDGDFHGV